MNNYPEKGLLFLYYILSCKADLNRILKYMENNFDEKFNKTYTHNRKRKDVKRRFIPNCIVADKLTMAILEYAYYSLTNDKQDEEIIQIFCDRINKFDKNGIPKIITQLEINNLKLYLIIESELKNGVFRLQYSEILELNNKNK